eukprot:134277-Amphidinium_carterae.1
MYLDRAMDDEKHMVQVLSRLNRRMHGKHSAFVVDFRNDPHRVRRAFADFRCEKMTCNVSGHMSAAIQLEGVLTKLSEQIEGKATLSEEAVEEEYQTYRMLCEKLGVLCSPTLRMFAIAASGQKRGVPCVYTERFAEGLLRKAVPSARYGGIAEIDTRRTKNTVLSTRGEQAGTSVRLQRVWNEQTGLDRDFKAALRSPALEGGFSPLVPLVQRRLASAKEEHLEVVLKGPAVAVDALMEAGVSGATVSLKNMKRSALFPIFICTKSRADVGLLQWSADHCLGKESRDPGFSFVPVVL